MDDLDYTIAVNRLRLHARHGVFAQEHTVGNDFEVSVRVVATVGADSYCHDNLDATISYADVIGIIRAQMAQSSALLENVAWRIATALRAMSPRVVKVTVEVAKLAPPVPSVSLTSASVSVTL